MTEVKNEADQWIQLYQIADQLKRMKPWAYLWDTDLISLIFPDGQEPIFCSVMGMAGSCFGVGLYQGYGQLDSFFRLVDSTGLPKHVVLSYQNCLMCYFGDKKELHPRELTQIKALGLDYPEQQQWPYFRSHETGFFPWMLNAEDLRVMVLGLQQLVMALQDMESQRLAPDFSGGETLVRQYNQEKQTWLTFVAPLPPIPIGRGRLIIEDELLVAKLKKEKKTKSILEVALFYLPLPVEDQRSSKPFFPHMVLLADHRTGEMLDQRMLDLPEDGQAALMSLLVKFITDAGRPHSLFVRDGLTEDVFADLCGKLGIELKLSPKLWAIEAMEEDLISYMENLAQLT